jgi:hypothetical protein
LFSGACPDRKTVVHPRSGRGQAFRDRLILLKFRAPPRRTKAEIGGKVAYNYGAFDPSQNCNFATWQRNGLGISIETIRLSKKFGWKFSRVFRLNDEGITVPAFSFEKIPAPPRIDTTSPAVDARRRGRFARLVDRLAELRMRSEARRAMRAKPRKVK